MTNPSCCYYTRGGLLLSSLGRTSSSSMGDGFRRHQLAVTTPSPLYQPSSRQQQLLRYLGRVDTTTATVSSNARHRQLHMLRWPRQGGSRSDVYSSAANPIDRLQVSLHPHCHLRCWFSTRRDTAAILPCFASTQGDDRTSTRSTSNAVSISSTEKKKKKSVITYLTDVEGDRAYLQRYVDQSKLLYWRKVTPNDDEMMAGATNHYVGFSFPYDQCIEFRTTIRNKSDGDDTNCDQDDDDDVDSNILPILVYGGDVWDQGGYDLFVIRQLLHFKYRYPNTVHFVMGNRDINKMRVTEELGRSQRQQQQRNGSTTNDAPPQQLPQHRGVYWLRNTSIAGDPTLPEQPLMFAAAAAMNNAAAEEAPPVAKMAVERLQWMLRHTMGSPRAFGYRQEELMEERALQYPEQQQQYATTVSLTDDVPSVSDVIDHDVVESYRQSCDPVSGEMSLHLRNAHLMLRLGDVAFVHGALPFTSDNLQHQLDEMSGNASSSNSSSIWDDLTFAMPWLEPGISAHDFGVTSIDDWIVALNEFALSRVQSWIESAEDTTESEMWSWKGGYFGDGNTNSKKTRPLHHQLMQYGMGSTPDGKRNPTVVYNSWGVAGTPRKFFRHDPHCRLDLAYVQYTQDFFHRTGLRLICSGHQPAGEMPNHIRINHIDSDDGVATVSWIMCCDTSYTGDTTWLNLPCDDESRHRQNVGRGDVKSGRGPVAVSEVLIEQCAETGSIVDVYCHGTLSDGTSFTSKSLPFHSSNVDSIEKQDLVVGTLASGHLVPSEDDSPHKGQWWTQSALSNGSILLAAGEGFRFWTRLITRR